MNPENNPLDRAVTDVTFVPKSDIFQRRYGIATQHPSQAGQPLSVIGLRLCAWH